MIRSIERTFSLFLLMCSGTSVQSAVDFASLHMKNSPRNSAENFFLFTAKSSENPSRFIRKPIEEIAKGSGIASLREESWGVVSDLRGGSLCEKEVIEASKEDRYVLKRGGNKEPLMFEKILKRLEQHCDGLDVIHLDLPAVAKKVSDGTYGGVRSQELDTLIAETCAYMNAEHPDYSKLSARISVSALHKETPENFSSAIEAMHSHIDSCTGMPAGLISNEVYNIVMRHKDRIDSAIDYSRDFDFNYFGYKTLERSYLIKMNGKVAERPQHMFMRVAIGIHKSDIDAALETYNLMSQKYFIHASPTLFNASTSCPQLSSCFLLDMMDDSISGIYDTLKRCALISKGAGGIGLSVHGIRAKGTGIRGTRGTSNGLVPMLRVFDSTARYVDQGGGKRPGAFAIYIEPWHADIEDVLELKKNHGKDELRARDLFYGLWIPDLFMKRVEEDKHWSLMCPHQCPGLSDCWGKEFESLYMKYEKEGRYVRQVPARDLWHRIIDAQIETGNPYMMYKDACNLKCNQQNLGTIRSSNLCCEIVEFTSKDEVAVCNLASVVLPRFVSEDGKSFNHDLLHRTVQVLTRNLNRIIDCNNYPLEESKRSDMRHRPIGIGVQGLADTFIMMKFSFESNEAKQLNKEIFETIYHAALTASSDLAAEFGPYESFAGSPISEGKFQFDLWGVQPDSKRYDWSALRAKVMATGVRNSLLTAPMPTASTAQILGYNECIEPYTSNIYVRRVKAGEFIVVNSHLFADLMKLGLWTPEVRAQLISDGGSVARIEGLPDDLRAIYKTVWEIKQKCIIDLAADRGAFVDQSQSMNLFLQEPSHSRLTSMHFYAWKKGLKTGMYYLRTRPAATAIQFTLDPHSGDSRQAVEACDATGCASCQG